jgi:hypothetical protein
MLKNVTSATGGTLLARSVAFTDGADGVFSLYEDDGKTFDYGKREFMRVIVVWNDRQRRLSLHLANGSKMLAPMTRNIVVRAAGEAVSREIVFEGRSVEVKL